MTLINHKLSQMQHAEYESQVSRHTSVTTTSGIETPVPLKSDWILGPIATLIAKLGTLFSMIVPNRVPIANDTVPKL